jgi:hypothetical protein
MKKMFPSLPTIEEDEEEKTEEKKDSMVIEFTCDECHFTSLLEGVHFSYYCLYEEEERKSPTPKRQKLADDVKYE